MIVDIPLIVMIMMFEHGRLKVQVDREFGSAVVFDILLIISCNELSVKLGRADEWLFLGGGTLWNGFSGLFQSHGLTLCLHDFFEAGPWYRFFLFAENEFESISSAWIKFVK